MAEFDWLGSLLGAGAGYLGSRGQDSQTTTQSVAPQFANLAAGVGQRGAELLNQPYTPYGYNRVSGFSPYQFAGFDMAADRAMNSQVPQQAERALGTALSGAQAPQMQNPYLGAMSYAGGANPYAGATASAGANGWEGKTTSVGSNPYAGANPYLEQNIQRTLGDITKSYNQNVAPTMAANAYQSGSFGNTGQAEMENTSRDMLQRNLGSTSANMRMQDYGMQQGMAEADIGRRMSAQQTDLARNANIAEGGLNRSMQGQLADLARNTGLYENAANRYQQASLADLSRNAQLFESGANRSYNGFESAQGRMMQGLGMSPSIYNMGYDPANRLMGIGGAMQQQGQAELDGMYGEFTDARDWAARMFNTARAPFGGISAGGTTTQTAPRGNPYSGLLGGAMIGNQMGQWWNTPSVGGP